MTNRCRQCDDPFADYGPGQRSVADPDLCEYCYLHPDPPALDYDGEQRARWEEEADLEGSYDYECDDFDRGCE